MLAVAITLAAGATGCGDDAPLTTAQFRLLGPPEPTETGRCPDLFEPSPPAAVGADRVRLTFRRADGGPLLCDVVLPTAGGNRVVAIPTVDAIPGPVDLSVELFGDLGAGPVLLARGDATAIALSSTSEVDVKVTPSGAFSCAHTRPPTARAFHTATLLPTGELLLAGGVSARPGSDDDVIDPSAGEGDLFAIGELEIVDPRRGRSRRLSVPGLVPRAMHSAVLLSADPIQIALIGGMTVNGDPETQPVLRPGAAGEPFRLVPATDAIPAPTQIVTYDPERLTATSQLVDETVSRGLMAASGPNGLLPDDGYPLIVGGFADATLAGANLTYDVLDPATGAGARTGALIGDRIGATVGTLGDGGALVWGGHLPALADPATAAGERLTNLGGSPGSQPLVIAQASVAPAPRAFHAMVPIGADRFLVAGGFAVDMGAARGPDPKVAQLVDVGLEVTVFDVTAPGTPPTGVGYPSLVGLGAGDALLSGGNPAIGYPGCPTDSTGLACSIADAYRYRAATGQLEPTGPLLIRRYGHASTVLADGTVAISGGLRSGSGLEVVRDLEIYDPREADDDPLADLRPGTVRSAGDVARDPTTLDPVAECIVIETEPAQ